MHWLHHQWGTTNEPVAYQKVFLGTSTFYFQVATSISCGCWICEFQNLLMGSSQETLQWNHDYGPDIIDKFHQSVSTTDTDVNKRNCNTTQYVFLYDYGPKISPHHPHMHRQSKHTEKDNIELPKSSHHQQDLISHQYNMRQKKFLMRYQHQDRAFFASIIRRINFLQDWANTTMVKNT